MAGLNRRNRLPYRYFPVSGMNKANFGGRFAALFWESLRFVSICRNELGRLATGRRISSGPTNTGAGLLSQQALAI
jgi:hypothetical protein